MTELTVTTDQPATLPKPVVRLDDTPYPTVDIIREDLDQQDPSLGSLSETPVPVGSSTVASTPLSASDETDSPPDAPRKSMNLFQSDLQDSLNPAVDNEAKLAV